MASIWISAPDAATAAPAAAPGVLVAVRFVAGAGKAVPTGPSETPLLPLVLGGAALLGKERATPVPAPAPLPVGSKGLYMPPIATAVGVLAWVPDVAVAVTTAAGPLLLLFLLLLFLFPPAPPREGAAATPTIMLSSISC